MIFGIPTYFSQLAVQVVWHFDSKLVLDSPAASIGIREIARKLIDERIYSWNEHPKVPWNLIVLQLFSYVFSFDSMAHGGLSHSQKSSAPLLKIGCQAQDPQVIKAVTQVESFKLYESQGAGRCFESIFLLVIIRQQLQTSWWSAVAGFSR